jgi:hypothetical protein
MARYEEAQLSDVLVKLQDKEALTLQDVGEILNTIVGTATHCNCFLL